jgi:hypothetical protein
VEQLYKKIMMIASPILLKIPVRSPSNRLSINRLGDDPLRFKRWPWKFMLLLSMSVLCLNTALAATTASEYQIKAVFLYNFSNFVTWPASTFENSTNEDFHICTYSENPFQRELELTVEGEKVNERIISIKHFTQLKDLYNCQILYISNSEKKQLDQLLPLLAEYPILTVSDIEGFAEQGGMIEFYLSNNRVRLIINITAARAVELVVSANLLRVSKVLEK